MPKSLSYIVCILILLGNGALRAQENSPVKVSIDRNQILIGEPILLSLDVKSATVSGNVLPQFDSIPHFEMIEKARLDSTVSANGASYHLEWKLTSFDSGTRVIPALMVTVGNQMYKTDSLAVEVSYVKTDPTQDYHDIKNIIDIENPAVKYIPWIVALVTLLALILFIWFIRFPLVQEEVFKETGSGRVSPFEEAMNSLDALKKLPLTDSAAVKKYYSGMNDVLRIYLNRRWGLVTMEKTNEELILTLNNQQMDRDSFLKLTSTLRMSDFVKFAKYVPGPNENETNLEQIRSSIVFINEKDK